MSEEFDDLRIAAIRDALMHWARPDQNGRKDYRAGTYQAAADALLYLQTKLKEANKT